MREKKLDLEEAIQEEKKVIDSLKKEDDALIKKNKVISHGVKCAKNDLEAFQLEKQKKMNELDMIVTLNLDQVSLSLEQTLNPRTIEFSVSLYQLQMVIFLFGESPTDNKFNDWLETDDKQIIPLNRVSRYH